MKRILLFTNVLLSGLIIWFATDLTMTWLDSRKSGALSDDTKGRVEAVVNSSNNRSKGLGEFSLITRKDVFDTTPEDAPQKAPPPPEEEIRITDLNLRLHGTVLGEDRNSYAIILEGGSGEQSLYYLNDFVMGARIEQILPDRVILELDGRIEALPLRKEERGATLGATEAVPQKRRTPSNRKRHGARMSPAF